MKRLIKRVVKAVYRRTEFIRAPIRAEMTSHYKACLTESFEETRVAFEDLVFEIHRLQRQVAELRGEIHALRELDGSAA